MYLGQKEGPRSSWHEQSTGKLPNNDGLKVAESADCSNILKLSLMVYIIDYITAQGLSSIETPLILTAFSHILDRFRVRPRSDLS